MVHGRDEDSHGMANQDAFVQVLLLNELLHVLRHNTVVVFTGMEGLTMVAQILSRNMSIQDISWPMTVRASGRHQNVPV